MDLFVFDIDGTLVDSKVRMSGRTVRALERISKKAEIVICTGRMCSSTVNILKKYIPSFLGKANLITYNGGRVQDAKGTLIYESLIDKDTAAEISKYFFSNGIYFQVYIDDQLYTYEDCVKIRDYSLHASVEYIIHEDLIELIRSAPSGPNKLLVIDEPDRLGTIQEFIGKYFSGVQSVMSFRNYLDIVPVGVSKGNALEKIALKLGADISKAFVFGDSQNDISMLRLTENSFAMGNSTENVKKVCKYIIPTNDEEGVAQILEKILDSDDIDTFCNSRYSSRN
jgi:hypothetical protein